MARKDPVHEFVQNNCSKPKDNSNGSNDNIRISKDNKITYIPEKKALVYYTITGDLEVIIGPHLPKFNLPWRKNFAYIDLSEKTTDYKARIFHTKNFIKIQTDLYIKTEVVDPRKYYLASQNFEETLFNIVQEKVMKYFQNSTKADLDARTEKLNLTLLGPNAFSEIETKYGVRITSIGTTEFNYPDLLDDAKVQAENKMRHEENLREQQRKVELQEKNRQFRLYEKETENMETASELQNLATLIKGMPAQEVAAITELIKWQKIGNLNLDSLTIVDNQNQGKKRK